MSKHARLNPHSEMNGSITALAYSLYRHRQLIYTLAKKDILGRYKQALIGVAWTFITPLLTLIIYTFIFSEIFKVRWSGSDGNGSKLEFALIIFSGMIIFSFFSEIMIRSTTIVSDNANYVKKVIFPLEILPIIVLCEAGFYALVSIGILLIFIIFFDVGSIKDIYLMPIVLIPYIFLCTGLSFFFAAIGVYIRDVNQAISSITTILMFLSPIFFPLSAVPGKFQQLIELNPLTFVIENLRNMLFFNHTLDMVGLMIYSLFSVLTLILGFYFFQKTRMGFSDVL